MERAALPDPWIGTCCVRGMSRPPSFVMVALLVLAAVACVDAERRFGPASVFRDAGLREANPTDTWVPYDSFDGAAVNPVDDVLELPDVVSDLAEDLSSELGIDTSPTSDLASDLTPDLATDDGTETIDVVGPLDVDPVDAADAETVVPTCIDDDGCSGDCDLGCPSACSCALDCRDNDGTCNVTCAGTSSCAVDCTGANNCEVMCKNSSTCMIDCRDANNCKPLHCTDDSFCEIDCRGANNCDDFKCDKRAQCYLRCTIDQDCGCRGSVSCGAGLIACNGAPCP